MGDLTGLLRLRERGLGVIGERLPPAAAAVGVMVLVVAGEVDDVDVVVVVVVVVSSSMEGLLSLEEKWRERRRISSPVGTVGRWFSRS